MLLVKFLFNFLVGVHGVNVIKILERRIYLLKKMVFLTHTCTTYELNKVFLLWEGNMLSYGALEMIVMVFIS